VTATPTSTNCTYFGGSDAGNRGSGGAPHAMASAFTQSVPVTISRMAVYLTSYAVSYQINLAIFNDNGGSPGPLVVQGTPQLMTVGWNQMPISDTVLPAGTYWLAIKTSGSSFGIKCDENQPGYIYYKLNDPWNNGNFTDPYSANYSNFYNKLSIEAVYCN